MKLTQQNINLKVINYSGGTKSKMSWNLIRQIKKSNSEDLYAIKNQNGEKIFNEKYLHENRKHEKDKMNDPIIDKEVQEAIELLKACVRYFLTTFYFSPNDSPSKTVKHVFYFI